MIGRRPHAVAVVRTVPAYPSAAPYHPSVPYPEYPFGAENLAPDHNGAYAAVRRLLAILCLDLPHFGTSGWNPLGRLIEPGMEVVIKPNFVLSRHPRGLDVYAVITHPAVLRAVADYCWIALRGQGRVVIADAPQYNCDFDELLATTRLREVVAFLDARGGARAAVHDLRRYWSAGKHFASLCRPLPGDPRGDVAVDLGSSSALGGMAPATVGKLYGAVYDRKETIAAHSQGRHRYEVSGTVLAADVVISVPKLKVHKKVGVTLNVKGLVGIATNKNLLAHYCLTPPRRGGDQYPDGHFGPIEEALIRLERWMYDHLLAPRQPGRERLHRGLYELHRRSLGRLGVKVAPARRQIDAGNWHGNDTAWRMALDLYRIFLFADSRGRLHDRPQRRVFSVIDGIIGGDNDGPLSPDPRPAGVLIGGGDLLATDLVATRLMGFDPGALRLYQAALADGAFGLTSLDDDVTVLDPDAEWRRACREAGRASLGFKPHPGWVGHLEAPPRPSAPAPVGLA